MKFSDTLAAISIPLYFDVPPSVKDSLTTQCISFVCNTGDVARIGSFVIVGRLLNDKESNTDGVFTCLSLHFCLFNGLHTLQELIVGKVVEILERQITGNDAIGTYIVVQKYETGGMHSQLRMPTLHGTMEKTHLLVGVRVRQYGPVLSTKADTSNQNVRHVLNVQHDCERGGCTISEESIETQEREKTANTVTVVKHTDTERFVVNVHGLHMPQITRSFFKSDLYSPPSVKDRQAHHLSCAATIRQKTAAKAAKKAKGKAVRQIPEATGVSTASKRKTANATGTAPKRRKTNADAEVHDSNVWSIGEGPALELEHTYYEQVWDPNELDALSDGAPANSGGESSSDEEDIVKGVDLS